MEEFLIVLVIFASVFGIVFVIASARNKERMAMIEKGVHPKDLMVDRKPNSYGILKWALLLAGLGFGLLLEASWKPTPTFRRNQPILLPLFSLAEWVYSWRS